MPALPTCNQCGAQFIAPVKFCEICGTRVTEGDTLGPAADERPERISQREPPASGHSGGPNHVPVPASSGRDLSEDADAARFLLPDAPGKQKAGRAILIGGIVLLGILFAAFSFIGLPMLTGSGMPGVFNKTATAEITPVPSSELVLPIQPSPAETPAPTQVADAFAPKPTQLLPPGNELSFLVYKDPVDAKIIITFIGGPGYDRLTSAEVKVTHPDGAVTSGVILPYKGAPEIILDGAEASDRVEIIAKMTDGRTYRVYDELVVF